MRITNIEIDYFHSGKPVTYIIPGPTEQYFVNLGARKPGLFTYLSLQQLKAQ